MALSSIIKKVMLSAIIFTEATLQIINLFEIYLKAGSRQNLNDSASANCQRAPNGYLALEGSIRR
jgi:hypothetical protein